MPFQFSLDTVLRVRGILEKQEERMLQKILYEISQTTEALALTNAEIAGSDAARQEGVFKQFIGRQLHASYGEIMNLKQARKDLEERLEKLEQLRERQLLVYQAARRNREMLTDMCEEKRCAYESNTTRREQMAIDDNFNARRGRI